MLKPLCVDSSHQRCSAAGHVELGDACPDGLAQQNGDPKRGAQTQSEEKLERRRETNRRAQANFRNRRQEALLQAETAVAECKAECERARARRADLQAAGRDLNARVVRASSALLSCIRKRTGAGSHTSSSSQDTHVSAGSHTRPQARAPGRPRRVLAPLHLDMLRGDSAPDVVEPDSAPPLMWHDAAAAAVVGVEDDCADSAVPSRFDPPDIGGSRRMAARLRAAKRAAADAAGAPPEAVLWVLQSPHATADGALVSFTSETVSARCMVSMYACFFISLLEEALLAAALRSVRPAPANGVDDMHGIHGHSGNDRGKSSVKLGAEPGADAPPASTAPRHHHSATVATLDNALHGTHDLCDSPLQMRCGLDSRVRVSEGVPHLVSSICRAMRVYLPRPMWLQACGLFAHFMAGMLRHKPLAAAFCPHAQQGPDGKRVHAVNTCPRCCVFGHMFVTLRDEVAAALEGEAWTSEVVPMAKLGARWAGLYGFCGLMTTQCMEDLPVLFRQMMSGMRERTCKGLVQEQQAVLELFRQLRMSPEQQATAAEAWRIWVRTRTTLDRLLDSALRPLSALLDLPDLVPDRCAAHSTRGVRSIESCGWDEAPGAATGSALPPPMEADAVAAAVGVCAGDAAAKMCMARVCLCEECAESLARRMVGVCRVATARAQRALAAVAELHRCDAAASVEQLRAICRPDFIFNTQQCALQTEVVLQRGVFTDWVSLCKTAAEELQTAELAAQLHQCCGAI